MKKMINKTTIEGYLYDNKLVEKTYSENAKRPGAKYIMGTVDIATDDEMKNVISVRFSFISEPENGDKAKPWEKQRYEILSNILNGSIKSVMNSDKEHAAKLQISGAIALTEFPTERNGVEEWVTAKRNEGSFIRAQSQLNDESKRDTFETDIIITGARRVEADEERDLPEKVIISGYIFDFRNAIMPVEFTVLQKGAMNYFENLEPSKRNPVFTRISGHQRSSVVRRKIVKESAFGDDVVDEVTSTRKDWEVTWAQKEEYEFDTEETITAEEVKKALADRELYIADQKSRRQNKGNAFAETPTPAATTPKKYNIKKATDAFDF